MSTKRRDVRIVKHGSTWFVEFVKRSKFQRYYAAQFYSPDYDLDYVTRWVNERPKLRLVSLVYQSA